MLPLKALANEDTLLQTQMFPRLPARTTFVAHTNIVSETQKMFPILFRTFCVRNKCFPVCAAWKHNIHFVSCAFAHPRNIMSNNVSSFARALKIVASHTKNCCEGNKSLLETREISLELAEDTQGAPNKFGAPCVARVLWASRDACFPPLLSYVFQKFETTRSPQPKGIGFSISLVCSASKSRAEGHNFNNWKESADIHSQFFFPRDF